MSVIVRLCCDRGGCPAHITTCGDRRFYSNEHPGWRARRMVNGQIKHRCPKHRWDWRLDDERVQP